MQKTPRNFGELRQRLLQPAAPLNTQRPFEPAEPEVRSSAIKPAAQAEDDATARSSPIRVAVAKAFESVRAFEERFTKLQILVGQVDRLGKEAMSSLESSRKFADRLEQLAATFEQVRDPYYELVRLASTFEPLAPLHSPIAQLLQTLSEKSTRLVAALQGAAAFYHQLLEMALVFGSAEELQQRFERLAAAFATNSPLPVHPESQLASIANQSQG